MTILLLRHVDAGDRGQWQGDDRQRPVSEIGAAQAAGLVEAYRDRDIVAIVTSPYLRCVQSVVPLAAATGVVVEEAEELAEGAAPDLVDRFLREQARRADGARSVVLCTHGDVVELVVTALRHRGALLPPDDQACAKGSTWVIDEPADAPRLSYLAPPVTS